MTEQKIKFVMIGLGNAGHMVGDESQKLSDLEIVAVYDNNPNKVVPFAK